MSKSIYEDVLDIVTEALEQPDNSVIFKHTGLNELKKVIEQAQKQEKLLERLVHRDISRKVEVVTSNYFKYPVCPNCKDEVNEYYKNKFCKECGQRLDWSEKEFKENENE